MSKTNDVMIIKALIFTPITAKPRLHMKRIKAKSNEVIFILTLVRLFKKETPIDMVSVLTNDKKLHTHNKTLYSSSS